MKPYDPQPTLNLSNFSCDIGFIHSNFLFESRHKIKFMILCNHAFKAWGESKNKG